MEHLWNKTLMPVMLAYDYGVQDRGPSGEKLWFLPNQERLASRVVPFFYDEYLNRLDELQSEVVKAAERIQPDLMIFAPYTNQFRPETLDQLRAQFKTLAWFGDDQWRFESHTKGLAPHFTYSVTTDPYRVPDYRQLGVRPIISQWAGQAPPSPPQFNDTYTHEVSFIGAANEARRWFIARLARLGVKVECFGAGWPNGRLSVEQMNELFLKSKISLNLSNSATQDISFVLGSPRNFARWLISKKQSEQIKARNFEIPLAGGFQLSKYALGLERYFKIGSEIAVFNTADECAQQIQYFLENEEERKEILKRSCTRALSEHTYFHRWEKILREVFT